MKVDREVQTRYARAASAPEPALCCPVEYDPRHLEMIPAEILERDYVCGDPSRRLAAGETVLDLGSGSGTISFIAARIVGRSGRVIGVVLNEEMLALAERHRPAIAARMGYDNVEFRRGGIQDLGTDLAALEARLRRHPIGSAEDLAAFENLRAARPLVADDSVDVVVSNCVLNHVADEDVPESPRRDPSSGRAVSPARSRRASSSTRSPRRSSMRSSSSPATSARGGRSTASSSVRSRCAPSRASTVPAGSTTRRIIDRGPWSEVKNDDGHTLRRGLPTAVCEEAFGLHTRAPYARDVIPIEPRVPIDASRSKPLDCSRDSLRHPRETKGLEYRATTATTAAAESCCAPGSSCE